MKRTDRGLSGFSIVEVLVALGVAALLALGGLAVSRSGATLGAPVSARAAETGDAAALQEAFRELASATLGMLIGVAPYNVTGFAALVTRVGDAGAPPEVYQVDYSVDSRGVWRRVGSQPQELVAAIPGRFEVYDADGTPVTCGTSSPTTCARQVSRVVFVPWETARFGSMSLSVLQGTGSGGSRTAQNTRNFPPPAMASPKSAVQVWDDLGPIAGARRCLILPGGANGGCSYNGSYPPPPGNDYGNFAWRAVWGTNGALGDVSISCRTPSTSWVGYTTRLGRADAGNNWTLYVWNWGVARCNWQNW